MSGRRKYRFQVGDVVRCTRELRTGVAWFAAGTLFTVIRRYSGYELKSYPCPTCGIQMRATRVQDKHLEVGQ